MKAGDAIFFANRIFHTAAPNLSRRVSKVLIYGYAYRWMKQEVYLENSDPQLLANTDPITRQCWEVQGRRYAALGVGEMGQELRRADRVTIMDNRSLSERH